MLDRSMLQLYQRRWQEVADLALKEERQRSLLQRWQKLNSLMRMAAGLKLTLDGSSQGEDVIWERWNTLRNLYLSKGNL